MNDPADLNYCRDVIRTGSSLFHATSKLLPGAVRDPAMALYAFCRLTDDEVDEGDNKGRAVLNLQDRLDLAYVGRPRIEPEDRAFTTIIEDFDMPRALPEALLEGLARSAVERRYDDLSGVRDYSARVAFAVGAMMCVLMRERDADALARTCDLCVAMQLTNIARDVGEDARAGRIYLPLEWLAEAGLEPAAFLGEPAASPVVRRMVRPSVVGGAAALSALRSGDTVRDGQRIKIAQRHIAQNTAKLRATLFSEQRGLRHGAGTGGNHRDNCNRAAKIRFGRHCLATSFS